MAKRPVKLLNRYCKSCKEETEFDSQMYCVTCGRTDAASEIYISGGKEKKSHSYSKSTNEVVDGYISWGIKVALLIGLFPFSLLLLVLAYGMEDSIRIIKDLIATGLRTVAFLIIFVIELAVLLIIIIAIFRK